MEITILQLFGCSEQAFRAKRREPGIPNQRRNWEWTSFEEDARYREVQPETLRAMSRLLERCRDSSLCEVAWGKGKQTGTFSLKLPSLARNPVYTFFSDGTLMLNLGNLEETEQQQIVRDRLLGKLENHVTLASRAEKYPNFQPGEWRPWAGEILEVAFNGAE